MDSKKKNKIGKIKRQEKAVEISEELMKELGNEVDVIVESSSILKEEKRRQKLRDEKKAVKEERKGKRAAKRDELEKKKMRKVQHDTVMAEIEKKQLSSDTLSIFKSSGTLGKKPTKKEKVRNAFYKEKLGMQLNDEEMAILHMKVPLEEEEEYTPVTSTNIPATQEGLSEDDLSDVLTTIKTNIPAEEVDSIYMEEEPVYIPEDVGPRGPTYADEVNKLVSSPTSGLTIRLNDDDLSDLNRLKEDIATAVPESLRGKSYFVEVKRSEELTKHRGELPVCGMEQEIMEAVGYHDVVIVCGETGSGKTTQIPQFLYEAGYGRSDSGHPGLIGITQPRRVAAVSMARRVAEELGTTCDSKGEVGYQIRYDSHTVGDNTKVKFMTDGILLKEIQSDFLLRSYSCILLDEAHERNLNTDLLLGLLSRIIPLRATTSSPLKLIIMSATLRVNDFTNPILFTPIPPIIHVAARQYPVGVHFAKRTVIDDYVNEAYKKVVQIHKRLPEGGVLVFLTGQQEIEELCGRFNKKFSPSAVAHQKNILKEEEKEANETPSFTALPGSTPLPTIFVPPKNDKGEEDVTVDGLEGFSDSDENEDISDIPEIDSFYDSVDQSTSPMYVLPLYSLLEEKKQMRIWDPIPAGERMIVVATNVAETSITIPGIKYVVDCGRAKEKVWDKETGVCEYKIQWISQASSLQRQGRAGRVSPGHCYRLFSSAVFQSFSEYDEPEIVRTPLEDTLLLMKHMCIANIERFPFPTSPDRGSLDAARGVLRAIGAVKGDKEDISAMGEEMMKYPVGVRYAKMIVLAQDQSAVLPLIVGLISSLTARSPVIRPEEIISRRKGMQKPQGNEESEEEEKEENKDDDDDDEELRNCRNSLNLWRDATSDALSTLRLLGAYIHAEAPSYFCQKFFLREKTVREMVELRKQIIRILVNDNPSFSLVLSKPLIPPSPSQSAIIRQIIASSLIDHVARKMTIIESRDLEIPQGRIPYVLTCLNNTIPAFIHRESFVLPLKTGDIDKYPEYVVFQDMIQKKEKVFLRGVTEINKTWLPRLAGNGPMCVFSSPLEIPNPHYDEKKDVIMCFVSPRFGEHFWELPAYSTQFPRDDASIYKWFARLLLEGKIISEFGILVSFYSSTPAMLNKPQLPIKAMSLVSALKREGIMTKKELESMWKRNNQYLKNELSAWILPRYLIVLSSIWSYLVEGKTVPDNIINGLKRRFGM